jgi:hypothetical protein
MVIKKITITWTTPVSNLKPQNTDGRCVWSSVYTFISQKPMDENKFYQCVVDTMVMYPSHFKIYF